LLNNNK